MRVARPDKVKKDKAWRVCLGVICQGKKKFRSLSSGNRICSECSRINKRLYPHDTHKFTK